MPFSYIYIRMYILGTEVYFLGAKNAKMSIQWNPKKFSFFLNFKINPLKVNIRVELSWKGVLMLASFFSENFHCYIWRRCAVSRRLTLITCSQLYTKNCSLWTAFLITHTDRHRGYIIYIPIDLRPDLIFAYQSGTSAAVRRVISKDLTATFHLFLYFSTYIWRRLFVIC